VPLGYLADVTQIQTPRVSVIQHQDDAPLDLLTTALTSVEVDVVRADRGEALPQLDQIDGLIVLGGSMNAHDDENSPWLPAVRDLLGAATRAEVPTLGVCLGAQLLAVACGGTVQVAAPTGPERGIIEVKLRPDAPVDPVLGPVAQSLGLVIPAPSMHSDAITDLPASATWLAASRHYPYQAFRIGTALGVQFHPEISAERLVQWASSYPEEDPAEMARQWQVNATELATLSSTLGEAFAAQVRESVQTKV